VQAREESERKRLEEWEKNDLKEWSEPKGRKGRKHQDMLRAFEWSFGRKGSTDSSGGVRRSASIWSGVSPGTSRMGSVDSSGAGAGAVRT